jgi:hypothetical protein
MYVICDFVVQSGRYIVTLLFMWYFIIYLFLPSNYHTALRMLSHCSLHAISLLFVGYHVVHRLMRALD